MEDSKIFNEILNIHTGGTGKRRPKCLDDVEGDVRKLRLLEEEIW